MKTFASIVALTAVAFAGAAHAQRPPSVVGHVGLDYTRSGLEVGSTNLDSDFISLEGAMSFGSDHIGGEIDGSATQSQLTPGDEQMAYAGTLHVNLRGDMGLVGGFAGLDNSEGFNVWGAGIEGQANISDWMILYGQLGYGETDDLVGIKSKLWAARVDARYYVTEDLRLQASAGYQHAKDGFGKRHAWIAGVEAEYMIPNTAFSVNAGYKRYEADAFDITSNVFSIGGRYTFGAPTLHGRDRTGATLGTVSRLFNFDLLRD